MFVKSPMFFFGGFFFEKEPCRKCVSLRGIDPQGRKSRKVYAPPPHLVRINPVFVYGALFI